MKTSWKIFAITFLISAIAIAGIAAFTLSRTTVVLHDLARQRLAESVNREARIVYNTLNMVKSDIQVLAEDIAMVEATPGMMAEPARRKLAESFSAHMQKRPAYTHIVLQMGASSDSGLISVEQTEDGIRAKGADAVPDSDLAMMLDAARSLWPGNVTVSKVLERSNRDRSAPKARLLYAATPIATKDGHVVGALVIAIDFDALVSGFGRPSTDITFFIGDRDGRYLYRATVPQDSTASTPTENIAQDFGLGPLWQKWSAGSDPQLHFDNAGKHLAVVLYRVLLADPVIGPSAPILVVGGTASLTEVDSQIVSFRSEIGIMALGVGGFVALALALATTYLTRPIQELTEVANRITVGDHDVSSSAEHRRDEFGILARAMMRMLEALRDSAKMKEQAAMGRMATMIAHDVRNALSSVKMNLKILHTHHSDEGDAYVDSCDIALEQVGYMENILTDMLDFARPDGLELDWLDIDDPLDVAVMSMMPLIAAQSVIFCTDGRHKLPKVLGDRTRLIQVFQNLLANAIQAMEGGGHLTIEANSQLHQSRPAVEISIADTGPGIPEDIRDKVLEPFFTTRAKGTGLGLTIVHRMIGSHDGELRLDPNPGGGTIARVILPLVPVNWQPPSGQ